jgi:hypothetical protein
MTLDTRYGAPTTRPPRRYGRACPSHFTTGRPTASPFSRSNRTDYVRERGRTSTGYESVGARFTETLTEYSAGNRIGRAHRASRDGRRVYRLRDPGGHVGTGGSGIGAPAAASRRSRGAVGSTAIVLWCAMT